MNSTIRQRKLRENSMLKRLDLLKEIYNVCCDDYAEFSIIEKATKHGVDAKITKTLIKSKILLRKRLQVHGVKYVYKWNSIKPNIKMVHKLSQYNYEIHSKATQEEVIESKKDTHSEIVVSKEKLKQEPKQEVKTKKEFSLFWGLITIKF